MTDIALGYTPANGKRAPNASWGERVYIQLRTGFCPREPIPVASAVWVWTGSGADIIAVKRVEE